MYTYICIKKRYKFNGVLVNNCYYYNYNTTKILDDTVFFLCGPICIYGICIYI